MSSVLAVVAVTNELATESWLLLVWFVHLGPMRSLDTFESKLAEGESLAFMGGRMPAGLFWKRETSGVPDLEDGAGIGGIGGTLGGRLPEATL